jgi:hypothetical protein
VFVGKKVDEAFHHVCSDFGLTVYRTWNVSDAIRIRANSIQIQIFNRTTITKKCNISLLTSSSL